MLSASIEETYQLFSLAKLRIDVVRINVQESLEHNFGHCRHTVAEEEVQVSFKFILVEVVICWLRVSKLRHDER